MPRRKHSSKQVVSYSWLLDWKCKGCGKTHTKPHFAFDNQVDFSKNPSDYGRIKDDIYDREGSGKLTCDSYAEKYGTGPEVNEKGLINPLFCPHCLLPDSEIYTQNGIKTIDKLNTHDLVYDINGNLTKIIKIVSHNYKGLIYGIKTLGHHKKIYMTSEHPIFVTIVNNNTMSLLVKRADQIEKNDVLIFPKSIEAKTKKEYWIIPQGKINIFPKIGKGNGAKTKLGYIKINKDLCRLFGYYLAEGYTKGTREIMFAFHQDELEYINDVVTILNNMGFKTYFKYNKDSKVKIVVVNNSGLAKSLDREFGHGAINKNIPHWIQQLPNELLEQIFIGYTRGDGCYILRGSQNRAVLEIKTISKNLAYSIKLLLSRFGCIPRIYYVREEGIHKEYYRINVSTQFFDEPNGKMFLGDRKTYFRYTSDINNLYPQIQQLEEQEYDGKVYDIETESHTFLTTGFVTHNCGWTDKLMYVIKK